MILPIFPKMMVFPADPLTDTGVMSEREATALYTEPLAISSVDHGLAPRNVTRFLERTSPTDEFPPGNDQAGGIISSVKRSILERPQRMRQRMCSSEEDTSDGLMVGFQGWQGALLHSKMLDSTVLAGCLPVRPDVSFLHQSAS